MIKILDSAQIRIADAKTIESQQIHSIDLMERAAKRWIETARPVLTKKMHYLIFCGKGNNGGDGLAIARLLKEEGYSLDVIHCFPDKSTLENSINRDAFVEQYPNHYQGIESIEQVSFHLCENIRFGIIDALLGHGISGQTQGTIADCIQWINNSQSNLILSVDLPSGLPAENAAEGESIVMADHVIGFEPPKLSYLMTENARFIKQWTTVSIDLDQNFLQSAVSPYYFVTRNGLYPYWKSRLRNAHKGSAGHLIAVAGNLGMSGAAMLCSKAAMVTGCGKLTLYSDPITYQGLINYAPECIWKDRYSEIPNKNHMQALVIGSGLGRSQEDQKLLENWLQLPVPSVIDADALRLLSINVSLQERIYPSSILTPHLKELEGFIGFCKYSYERISRTCELAKRLNCFIVIKGPNSATVCPDGLVYFNSSGNEGMATAGSGDVLSGIIGSLLAQGYEPKSAAILGVYLHGAAGDAARVDKGIHSLTASDLIQYLPYVMNRFSSDSAIWHSTHSAK